MAALSLDSRPRTPVAAFYPQGEGVTCRRTELGGIQDPEPELCLTQACSVFLKELDLWLVPLCLEAIWPPYSCFQVGQAWESRSQIEL